MRRIGNSRSKSGIVMKEEGKVFGIFVFCIAFSTIILSLLMACLAERVGAIPNSSYLDSADTSAFDADGPIIFYDETGTNCYSILPDHETLIVAKRTASNTDTFTCHVSQTGKSFSFNLRPRIVNEPDNYPLPTKMMIISDIEGNFEGFESILKGAGVIDSGLKWIFGSGHLVLNGDFFDRGLNVTECLWLIYKLETEAEFAGGKVHFILGNHEIMNLRGDLRYVRKKYIANADSLRFDYKLWYTPNTELGRWLRSKNCIERIGNYVFVHGGISPQLQAANLSISEVNDHLRNIIDRPYDASSSYKDSLILRKHGPLWYRGMAESELSPDTVSNILNAFEAEKVIIGHTIFDKISYLYDERIIAIDLDHSSNSSNGFMNALWFADGRFSVIDDKGILTEIRKAELPQATP